MSQRRGISSTPPATPPQRPQPSTISLIDAACRSIVDGKLAARDLTRWVKALDVSETEFRLLWLLQRASASSLASEAFLDQVALAERLAVSPAQVSGLVEHLAKAEYIVPHQLPADRRRQLWQLTLAGKLLLSNILARIEAHATQSMPAKEAA